MNSRSEFPVRMGHSHDMHDPCEAGCPRYAARASGEGAGEPEGVAQARDDLLMAIEPSGFSAAEVEARVDRLIAAARRAAGARMNERNVAALAKVLDEAQADALGLASEYDETELRHLAEALAARGVLVPAARGVRDAALPPEGSDGGSDLPNEIWAALHRWRIAHRQWNATEGGPSYRASARMALNAAIADVDRAIFGFRDAALPPAGGAPDWHRLYSDWLDETAQRALRGEPAPTADEACARFAQFAAERFAAARPAGEERDDG